MSTKDPLSPKVRQALENIPYVFRDRDGEDNIEESDEWKTIRDELLRLATLAAEPQAAGMDEARARPILEAIDLLDPGRDWLRARHDSDPSLACLEGEDFTADQLEAIAWWIRNKT